MVCKTECFRQAPHMNERETFEQENHNLSAAARQDNALTHYEMIFSLSNRFHLPYRCPQAVTHRPTVGFVLRDALVLYPRR